MEAKIEKMQDMFNNGKSWRKVKCKSLSERSQFETATHSVVLTMTFWKRQIICMVESSKSEPGRNGKYEQTNHKH